MIAAAFVAGSPGPPSRPSRSATPSTGSGRSPASSCARPSSPARSRSRRREDLRRPSRRSAAGRRRRDAGSARPRPATTRSSAASARLVDPSPPDAARRPGARAAARRRGARRTPLRRAAEAPAGAGRVARREFSVIPSLPGDAIDPEQLLAARRGGAHRRANALAGADARRARADDERRGSGRRRGEKLVAEPIALSFKGEDVGSLAPQRLAKLVRFRPAGERFRVTFAPRPDREGRRAVPRPTGASGRSTRASSSTESASRIRRRGRASHPTGAGSPTRSRPPRGVIDPPRLLRLKQIRADLTTAEANRLGIREQISTFTTDMGTSSSNRIHNVQLMAEYIDGTIDRARPRVLVQRPRRPADGRARVPRGADDHRLAAAPVDRRRRLPDGDDALQQRLRARPPDRRAAQPQLLHLALPARARRDRLLGRAGLRLQERPRRPGS